MQQLIVQHLSTALIEAVDALLPGIFQASRLMPLGVAHHKAMAQIGVAADLFRLLYYDDLFTGQLGCANCGHQATAAGTQNHQVTGFFHGGMSWNGLRVFRVVDDPRGTDLGAFSAADTLEFVNLIACARKPDCLDGAFIEAVMAGRTARPNVV